MTVRIVTDSACDLPQSIIDQYGIVVVPLTIRFGDTDYIDREAFGPKEFWAKCAASPVLPETAAPSPGQFETAYRGLQAQGATGIVVVSLSSALSATMQSAEIAAKAVAGDLPVRIVDSRSVSMGQGIIVRACAQAAQAGAGLDEVEAKGKSLSGRVHVYGALDTLENLKKGGRIGGAKAMIASALAIKPIIDVREGKVEEGGRAHAFEGARLSHPEGERARQHLRPRRPARRMRRHRRVPRAVAHGLLGLDRDRRHRSRHRHTRRPRHHRCRVL